MEELKELVSVVTKHTNAYSQYLSTLLDQAPKMKKLFAGIRDGDFPTDTEACIAIYGNIGGLRNYRGIKQRLKTRLIDSLFFIGTGTLASTQTNDAFVRVHRNWMAVRLLLSQGANISATKLAERTFKEASKYEFTVVCKLLSSFLQLFFGVVMGNTKKHQYYLKQYHVFHSIQQAEQDAEIAYAQAMTMHSVSQRTLTKTEIERLDLLVTHIFTQHKHIDSRRFIQISYILAASVSHLANRTEEELKICNEAIARLTSKPFDNQIVITPFERKKLMCYIRLEYFDRGERIAKSLLSKMIVGSFNWYSTLYYNFILYARSKLYKNCNDIVLIATQNKSYYKLNARLKELWRINEAYTTLLIARGKVPTIQQAELKPFRIYRFINQIPIFSRDKRGVNIAVLIIHVLFLLHQHKRGKIIDRVDALNRYCHRHLRRDETFRSNCFIQMLLQIPRADFNRMRTERYAEKYKKKLATMPLKTARQSIEVEVFPYEHLWEIALEMLD